MAWTNSKIFSSFLADMANNAAAFDMDGDALKAALFDNTITPSQTVASAAAAYGGGVWAGGGVFDASGWPAVGRPLASIASGFASNIYTLDAADTVSANSTSGITNATGVLIYDDTLASPVADQAMAFLYLGGVNSLVNGQFSVIWHASGLMTITA